MENQFGSFGQGLPPEAMEAVKQALARRQQGGSTPALDQQSGASPTASPPPPQPQGGVEVPQEAPPEPQAPPQNAEAELIVKALAERLKRITPKGV